MTTYWEDIITFFRQTPELNDWLTDNESGILQEIPNDVMNVWKEAVAYQGFDILRVRKLARAAFLDYTAHNVDQRVDMQVVVGGAQRGFSFSNKETMAKDLQFLFFVFANRGCNYQKVRDKSNTETTFILEWLVAKYNIDTTIRASGSALGQDVITIPRLKACFPTVFCDIFHAGKARDVVTKTDMELPQGVSEAALCPKIVSCIPPGIINVANNCHMVFFCVHVLLDDILHRRTGNFTPLDMILSYYKAAYNSPAVPVAARGRYLEKVGQDSFINEIMAMVGQCKQKIMASR